MRRLEEGYWLLVTVKRREEKRSSSSDFDEGKIVSRCTSTRGKIK
jgi:hypothetical protein